MEDCTLKKYLLLALLLRTSEDRGIKKEESQKILAKVESIKCLDEDQIDNKEIEDVEDICKNGEDSADDEV